ncbi:CEQ_1a_G0013060.mRNA.1.CDS.1 [Saccharomyces cerevisiae]|nr:CEQ_1a_G0013060.mRNA.1.CDS.1 [Saccharomyces cerevisiae]CAI7242798.1 CEQ_1a_G0013060.mRNA.1.CDS.1 [Saccharomyces cerevisiae]
MKKEKKTPTPLPSHHVLFAEPGFFLCNFFFVLLKHTQINPFFLFSIYFVIYHLYSNNILCFYSYFTLFFSLCRQCNSLGRMIFMCAYLPAASSRSVANPALPPPKKKKKKKKKKKGTLRTGEVEEQAKGNISFDLCGKQNFQ